MCPWRGARAGLKMGLWPSGDAVFLCSGEGRLLAALPLHTGTSDQPLPRPAQPTLPPTVSRRKATAKKTLQRAG